MNDLAPTLRLLGDPSRLRIVRLLALEPGLRAGEIVRVLGLSQPSVSRALGELERRGVVLVERGRGTARYALASGSGLLEALVPLVREAGDAEGDRARLAEVLRERVEAGEGAREGLLEPGRSWAAWARALARLVAPLRVADFGCGDGALTAEIARFARSVAAVEKHAGRLAAARARIKALGLANVRFLHEAIERTSLPSASQDLVVLSQVLHHLAEPEAALASAARVLAAGGRILVLELAEHREEWVRQKLGHRRLGFPPRELEKLLLGAGLDRPSVDPMAGRGVSEPFRVLVATAVKP